MCIGTLLRDPAPIDPRTYPPLEALSLARFLFPFIALPASPGRSSPSLCPRDLSLVITLALSCLCLACLSRGRSLVSTQQSSLLLRSSLALCSGSASALYHLYMLVCSLTEPAWSAPSPGIVGNQGLAHAYTHENRRAPDSALFLCIGGIGAQLPFLIIGVESGLSAKVW